MKVLVVDDEAGLCFAFRKIVEDLGDQIETAANGRIALQKFETQKPDAVFLDVRLPDANGLEILDKMREQRAETPIIVMTAHGGFDVAVEAMQKGALDYLVKPISPKQVREALEKARQFRQKKETDEQATPANTRLIGRSSAIQDIFKNIGILAASDAPVLIQGETGTGKELIASALHFAGPRKTNAFEPVDCASLPSELIESELFGHVKGAFTGAIKDRTGRIKLAAGGTLFLDEIGELPITLQPKLLRFLAEQEIVPVGSGQRQQVSVRVIAATNRDLKQQVEAGQFRADLYYRLSVMTLQLPALRDRKQDIPLLIQHFLEPFPEIESLSPQLQQKLNNYHWPGNVRELKNAIVQAATLARGSMLTFNDLSKPLQHAIEQAPPSIAGVEPGQPLTGKSLDQLVAYSRNVAEAWLDYCLEHGQSPFATMTNELETAMIKAALERVGDSRSAAARMLEINRATLRKRLKPDDDS